MSITLILHTHIKTEMVRCPLKIRKIMLFIQEESDSIWQQQVMLEKYVIVCQEATPLNTGPDGSKPG